MGNRYSNKAIDSYEVILKPYDGSEPISYRIVTNRNDINKENAIIHFSDDVARKIIYTIYKNKIFVEVDGKEYYILRIKQIGDIKKWVQPNSMVDYFITEHVQLKKDISEYAEKIETLIFVEEIDELIPVVIFKDKINKEDDYRYYEYVMRIGDYKECVRKYGKPSIKDLVFYTEHIDENIPFSRKESILNAYGYSVSKLDDYSIESRQKLLDEVINLGLMTSNGIVDLLKHNINMHKGDQYKIARIKWRQDIDYLLGKSRLGKNTIIVKR